MGYIVEFGGNTDLETYDSMDDINVWLDDYITDHLQGKDDFQTEKKRFIAYNITEIV